MNEIYIIHTDWDGIGILDENNIYRKNLDEKGTYSIYQNKMIVKWEKWNNEIFPTIKMFSVFKIKEKPSLSSRSIFKYKDIVDKIT